MMGWRRFLGPLAAQDEGEGREADAQLSNIKRLERSELTAVQGVTAIERWFTLPAHFGNK